MVRLQQQVKKNSPVYLYQHVCQGLKQLLLEIDLRPGDKLPTRALATVLHLGTPTVQHAMGRLADEGLVTKNPGQGTFVL